MPGNIKRWLEEVGLGKYSELFSENGIDLDIVGELGDADLKDLGIALGDRKRLLKAIAALSARSGVTSTAAQPSAEPAPAQPSEAQRRQLTVMFCDLVGSTALSRRLDPEDLREAVRAYQQLCAGIVARLDGFVAQYLGDGILVYFGWPRAHESDAERAVRAGLSIVEAMQGADAPKAGGEPLSVRIGVATGPVVIGDLIGSAAGKEATATGETPNLAARIQELAPANGIVIAPSTHALTGALFDCVSLGERQFKGFTAPVAVFQVIRERPAESRFEAVRANQLVPFVGREHEIGLILERWQEAKAGEGQVVLLSGEAGIGKSRIAQTLRERITSEPHTRLRYQCSPYYVSTAFQPFIAQLERATGFAPEDAAERKLEKIEAVVAAGGADPTEVTPFLASLLSVSLEDRYPPLDLPAQQLKARITAALTEQLVGLAAKQPVLLIFEDAHWADPTSLEVLDQTIGRIATLRVLAVITTRPEFEARWGQHAHVTFLTLNRLSRAQSGTLVEGVTTGKTLPSEVLEQIIAKTDGVPLFVEELTRTVLESGLLVHNGDRFELTGPLPPLAIPATLQDSLNSRLDRLDAVKELAQIGAAIGREFPYKLIAAVTPLQGAELNSGLDRLVASGLVFRQGSGETARYLFKHALVQDAAYGSLLRSRRQLLHQKLAQALIEHFPNTANSEPEVVAHHYTEAGLGGSAIDYWRMAGQLAAKRSANMEAVTHFSKAIELLGALPSTKARDGKELDLQVALANPLMAVKGYASPEVRQTNARALQLCDSLGSSPSVFPVLYTNWAISFVSGHVNESRTIAQNYLRRAMEQVDLRTKILGHRMLGTAECFAGCNVEAESQLSHAIALCKELRVEELDVIYGQDIKASALCIGSYSLSALGYATQATQRARMALDRARQVKHANTLAYVQGNVIILSMVYQDIDVVVDLADELVQTAGKQGVIAWELVGRYAQAWVRAHRKPEWQEIEACGDALARLIAENFIIFRCLALGQLAVLFGRAGDPERGIATVREALTEVEDRGNRLGEAELYRVKGELEAQSRNAREAERSFHQATQTAKAQENRALNLRSSVSLARLWQSQGRCAEALQMLAPIYGWFTEGLDTDDLKNAKALLDELQA